MKNVFVRFQDQDIVKITLFDYLDAFTHLTSKSSLSGNSKKGILRDLLATPCDKVVTLIMFGIILNKRLDGKQGLNKKNRQRFRNTKTLLPTT